MSGTRLDQRVVQLGLVESREKAQRLILAGCVKVNDRVETKASHSVPDDAVVALVEQERFVGRGGEKLEEAFVRFALDVKGKVCMDVGASTGGFTDCLLQHGAARVYAVDVGKGQIHSKLRSDPRVVVMDGVNARYLVPASIPEVPDFATIDVSFISLTKILPAVTQVLANGGRIISLIKPQFEAGREQVGKGGVVRSEAVRDEVVERVRSFGVGELGLKWLGVCPSPIKGPAGNVEFLAYWEKVGK
jgi:23S rRNA (cytidine1920-2'-O)/16S rRNA (cytidine1409-2'-O)-methyltransferase